LIRGPSSCHQDVEAIDFVAGQRWRVLIKGSHQPKKSSVNFYIRYITDLSYPRRLLRLTAWRMEVITIFGTTCALISIPQGTTPWWGTSIQTNEYSKSRICHQSDIPSYSYLPNLQTKSLSNLPISTLPPRCEVSTLLLLRLLPYFFCMPAASVTTAGLGMTNPERWCNSLITVGIGVIYS